MILFKKLYLILIRTKEIETRLSDYKRNELSPKVRGSILFIHASEIKAD